jgi:hypothetical protein
VTQALDRVRQAASSKQQAARTRKKERFTALLHHVDIDLLRIAFLALQRDAAPGVDGLTWWDYEADLEPRLAALHDRVQRGAYRPLPSRRTYIPKADGKQRPLATVSAGVRRKMPPPPLRFSQEDGSDSNCRPSPKRLQRRPHSEDRFQAGRPYYPCQREIPEPTVQGPNAEFSRRQAVQFPQDRLPWPIVADIPLPAQVGPGIIRTTARAAGRKNRII